MEGEHPVGPCGRLQGGNAPLPAGENRSVRLAGHMSRRALDDSKHSGLCRSPITHPPSTLGQMVRKSFSNF